jgi:hypothetical protein
MEIKKRRRKESINNKLTSVEIRINAHSTTNSTPLPIKNIIHQPNCQYHQLADALSVRTPPSICPSFADAPAASPEQSDIVDSIYTPSATVELDTIPHSQSSNYDLDNSSIPSVLLNRISIKQPIKSNYLEDLETIQNQCDCYHQNDISDQLYINREEEEEEEEEEEQEENKIKQKSNISQFCDQYIYSRFITFRKYISNFVASKYFRRIVLSAIVVNTLSMGIEYHGQPPSLTNALEYSNLVFTSLFAIEMILKIIADGCLKYIKNAYNLFDGGIVLMSVIELQGNKNSGLSVLRTFRLLRVLKLVRFMPTLRRQLVRNLFNSFVKLFCSLLKNLFSNQLLLKRIKGFFR